MFEYKPASFYTSYFKNHPAFTVKEEFQVSKEKDEKNLYVGYVEVLDTIHELVLRVEIPQNFPHQHLVFRTSSISGYPHLIPNGKKKYGAWFCLNTPFGETAEEQLDLEIQRLNEWIARCMRKDLPAHIKDYEVTLALSETNAYAWENHDEVNELHESARLTLVGETYNDLALFPQKLGYLNCIKTPDKRFYAISHGEKTNATLPYIIVDELPQSSDILKDFIALKSFYGWDDEICKHLLPEISFSLDWEVSYSSFGGHKPLEEALDEINEVRELLEQEVPYLKGAEGLNIVMPRKEIDTLIRVSPHQKELLLKELDKIEESTKKDQAWNGCGSLKIWNKNLDEMSPEEEIEWFQAQEEEDDAINIKPLEWHSFALAFKEEGILSWCVVTTTSNSANKESVTFDLGLKNVALSKLVAHHIYWQQAAVVERKQFWGRGALSKKFQQKRIALIGLGAIGSMIAESLARSGVTAIGLWDGDVVEPGNICRSTYQLQDLGESKVLATTRKIKAINPYLEVREIKPAGKWYYQDDVNPSFYVAGNFYGNINYESQEDCLKKIRGFDFIIDCTGSNELLHFLSYAVPDIPIVSLCITNHSNDLLCVTNKHGNPFELRKAYLSRIEQDTKNFYLEGSGCYAPTFLARNCDIASLVHLSIREINTAIDAGAIPNSMVISHDSRGVLIDQIETYKAENLDIWLSVPSEALFDAEDLADDAQGELGYLLGCFSRDGKMIMLTHVVSPDEAEEVLRDAFQTSKSIIDYIGDYTYSGEKADTFTKETLELLRTKAEDQSINTNNPLLALRNPDGTVSFFLYINNGLVPFHKQD